ncbi:MAG: cytochrome c3 family protein [Candidatus Krumholzibacteriia bacterium]
MIGLLLLLLGAPGRPAAQSTADCFDCHDDPGLVTIRNGEEISLQVGEAMFRSSIHGQQGLECIDCHADIDELPHASELEPPLHCDNCHDEVAEVYSHSLHGELVAAGADLAPRCWDCHTAHEILPPENPDSQVNRFNIPFMCGRCHKEGTPVTEFYDIPQDSILTHYSLSMHGEGLYKRGLTISAICSDCHTAHSVLPSTDPRSTIHGDNVAATCQMCHGRIEEVHTRVIEGRLWEEQPGSVPVCVECHEPHEVRRVFYETGMSNRECMECHGKPDLFAVQDGDTVSMFVDMPELLGSTHNRTTCVQCHVDITVEHSREGTPIEEKVNCAVCHAEQVALHSTGMHGMLQAQGDPAAPECVTCHGSHGTLPRSDRSSPIHVRNVPDLCGRCHGPGGVADQRHPETGTNMVENFKESIHGRGLTGAGLVVSATCTHCHSAHQVLPPTDPRSSISRQNIVETCTACHEGIFEEFAGSIHDRGEPRGGHPLPMCDDCHSSHEIVRTDAQGFVREIVSTCGKCHPEDTESYFQTYHGKVFKLGYTETAKCQDCHGAHTILPPENLDSSLSRENIVATCAQCHPGAHRQFAGYLTHATHHDRNKYPFIYWTWLFMTSLLVGTFTFFGIHTLLWLPRSFQALKHSRQLRAQAAGQPQFLRFPKLYRQLHILVIISFLTLAVTGMTLKFSYLPWARWIAEALGGFQGAGTLHRLAAIVTFYYFARHIIDLVYRKRKTGKSWREFITGPDGMMFNARDGQELVATFRWFIGMGPRPAYGRWTYWEKFDYFAVFWGVGMIGFSGLILWFPELFTYVMPGWFINIATIIHSDEALLATGFIFTVHFFNTHFRPDRFPMDPVIFTGRVTVEELKEDRPREYAKLVETGELQRGLVEPMGESMAKALKVFGFVALTIGLSLVLLIIVAELFGYR